MDASPSEVSSNPGSSTSDQRDAGAGPLFVSAKIPRHRRAVVHGKVVQFYEVHLRQETNAKLLVQSAVKMALGYSSVDLPEKRAWVRYRQFESLHHDVVKVHGMKHFLPPFPKKLLVHSDANLEHRRAALEQWLATAVAMSLRRAFSESETHEPDYLQSVISSWCMDVVKASEELRPTEVDFQGLTLTEAENQQNAVTELLFDGDDSDFEGTEEVVEAVLVQAQDGIRATATPGEVSDSGGVIAPAEAETSKK